MMCLVKKNEARLENFFRPVFLRSIAEEFFDYLDKNNDNQISVADITRCEPLQNTSFCLHMNPLENKTVDNCHLLGSPLEHVCTTLMTTYFSPDFDLIDTIHVNKKELEGTILGIFQFLAGAPGKTEIGLEEIVDGFARLGEPPQVVDSLRQLLTPILNTCAGEDGNCFPSPWTTGDLKRYFSK